MSSATIFCLEPVYIFSAKQESPDFCVSLDLILAFWPSIVISLQHQLSCFHRDTEIRSVAGIFRCPDLRSPRHHRGRSLRPVLLVVCPLLHQLTGYWGYLLAPSPAFSEAAYKYSSAEVQSSQHLNTGRD